MNARFWVYVNGGAVKLTLHPGQSLHHAEGGPNEEGYCWDYTRWYYPAEQGSTPRVYRYWMVRAHDCDGRHEEAGKDYCAVEPVWARQINGVPPYPPDPKWEGVLWPVWHQAEPVEVFDEYAQLAGY